MNIIVIIADTFRRDYMGVYGGWAKTPHLDALASESVRFTNFFAASYPTGPNRKDFHTGRFTFTYHSWGSRWQPVDTLIAEMLRREKYATAIIGDTICNPAFDLRFQYAEFILGQGPRRLHPLDMELPLPADERKLRTPRIRLQAILENETLWKGEEDHFCAQTMRAAHRWIENFGRRNQPFFLVVDTFDPHEPWDPPRYYIDRYDPDYEGDELFEPAYEPAGYATPREIQHMRAMYAGEVSFVDRWIGYLLEGVKQMDLWDETAIIFTTDHGFYHGEHGLIGKVHLDRDGTIIRRYALYDTLIRIPLIIKAPEAKPNSVCNALCQTPDLTPTILELAGVKVPETMQGKSLLPLLRNETEGFRDAVISSYTYLQDRDVRAPTTFRTKDWLYIYGGDEWKCELYDLRRDPDQTRNVFDDNLDVAKDLHEEYLNFLAAIDCPPDCLEGRREFPPRIRANLPRRRIL